MRDEGLREGLFGSRRAIHRRSARQSASTPLHANIKIEFACIELNATDGGDCFKSASDGFAQPGQSPPTEGNLRTEAVRIKVLTPACAGAMNQSECQSAETKALHAAGNGEAEPATLSSAAPSSLRPRELSRRCLEPARASFDADPLAAGGARATGESRALRQGAYRTFCRHKKDHRTPSRPGQSPPTEDTPRNQKQAIKGCTGPACAGRDES